MNEYFKHKLKHNFQRLKIATKWIVFSILSGILIGGVGISFYYCMDL